MARREWDRLVGLALAMRVLTKADGPALEAVCVAYEELTATRKVIAREGRFYSTESRGGSVMKRAHPAVAVGADAWRRYVAGLAHFGLTPAARGKVAAVPEPERDDLAAWEAQARVIDGGRA